MNNYVNDFDKSNKLYYKDLKKYKPLDKQTERKLFLKFKNNNDLSARNQLITSNLKFVVDIAKQYKGHGLSFGDLVSEGNMGLLKAIDKFDEKKDTKIISYGVWWIRQYIKDAINRKKNMPIDELPEDNEKQVFDDDLLYNDEDNIKKSFLDNDETYENNDDAEAVKKLLSFLTERERNVIILYFGLNGEEQKTLEEIGIKYNLTKERVRQIKEVALKKLRSNVLLIGNKYLLNRL